MTKKKKTAWVCMFASADAQENLAILPVPEQSKRHKRDAVLLYFCRQFPDFAFVGQENPVSAFVSIKTVVCDEINHNVSQVVIAQLLYLSSVDDTADITILVCLVISLIFL